MDVETGKPLGTNEEGELWIRGPQLSSGYLNLPAQTAELLAEDGWMRTGISLGFIIDYIIFTMFILRTWILISYNCPKT